MFSKFSLTSQPVDHHVEMKIFDTLKSQKKKKSSIQSHQLFRNLMDITNFKKFFNLDVRKCLSRRLKNDLKLIISLEHTKNRS